MNIGFVSTWFERGAAYVTRAYIDVIKEQHNIYVYARGGEKYAIADPQWDLPYVTWGLRLSGTRINFGHFKKWIIVNQLDILFFNEQHEIDIIAHIKREFPTIKLGAYIDYYKGDTVNEFWLYDFLICNTKRHYSVFKNHPQCFYIPWGTDIKLFEPKQKNDEQIVFFHSVGMSFRKGTDVLVDTFIKYKLYEKSKLIIHTQIPLQNLVGHDYRTLNSHNIEVIEETVPAPGLYFLGDVYVYPTTLEGLGLTIYEALSSGLPVITTNSPPMNEVVTQDIGKLIDVEKYTCREDGYYWPVATVNQDSLFRCMDFYIENRDELYRQRINARTYAVHNLEWSKRKTCVQTVFQETHLCEKDLELQAKIIKSDKKRKLGNLYRSFNAIMPPTVEHFVNYLLKKVTKPDA